MMVEDPISEAGASPHLAALLNGTHEGTWVSVDGLDDVLHTQLGTAPGDPLGDRIYHCLMTRVVRVVREESRASNIAFDIEWSGSRSFAKREGGRP